MADASSKTKIDDRCRLVLIANTTSIAETDKAERENGFRECVKAGDIASIVFDDGGLDESVFQDVVEPLVKVAQQNGVASIIVGQSRVAGRVGADGLQLGQDPGALAEAIPKFHPAMMVGAGNVKTRHNALVLGEMQPDYVMFGKPGGDMKPEPNPKNLDLGAWWSSMIEIPCIVLGGNSVESAVAVAETRAEFVALGEAIFATHNGRIDFGAAASAITHVNRLLSEHAPRFELEE